MGTYKIDNLDLFAFVKDLEQSKILSIEGHQQHVILLEGQEWHEDSRNRDGSCLVTFVTSDSSKSKEKQMTTEMGNIFLSPLFIIIWLIIINTKGED